MLTPTNYRTIFDTSTWWQTMAPNFDTCTFQQGSNSVTFPYSITQKAGVRFLRNPHLTPYVLPLWQGVQSNNEKKQLLEEAIQQLPPSDVAEWHWHPNCGELHVPGYRSELHHTRCLPLKPIDELWHNCKSSLQRQIKKGKKSLRIQTNFDAPLLYNMQTQSLNRSGKNKGIPLVELEKAIALVQHQNNGYVVSATYNNEVVAAILIVWDEYSTYYLGGGTTREGQVHGAMSSLLWFAIEDAVKRQSQYFDFEGSRHEGIDRFFSQFGAEKVSYTVLVKNNSWLHKIYQQIKPWFSA
jgi:hypothetical protein